MKDRKSSAWKNVKSAFALYSMWLTLYTIDRSIRFSCAFGAWLNLPSKTFRAWQRLANDEQLTNSDS